jgi:dihydrofolate reductase
MRTIRYAVAMSVDGYMAGPNGEADWIGLDPEVDFAAVRAQFDTLLRGRRTYEVARKRLRGGVREESPPSSFRGPCSNQTTRK